MPFLSKILSSRRAAIADAKCRVPLLILEQAAQHRTDFRSLTAALEPTETRIIAEIKRASPSRGPIDLELDPATLARSYAGGGAAALSVLTEPEFFKGSNDDLKAARGAASIPVLRKDFILDPYQVYETAAMGADAILLIVRILDDSSLAQLYNLSRSLHLEVLVEVFDEADIDRIKTLKPKLVGINNRDLSRFTTDLSQAPKLATLLPSGTIPIALSGIGSLKDIQDNQAHGISRFLVGEALVRQADPAATLRAWSSPTPVGL